MTRAEYYFDVPTGNGTGTVWVGFSTVKELYEDVLTLVGATAVTTANRQKVKMDAKLSDFGVPRIRCTTEKSGTPAKSYQALMYCAVGKIDDLLAEVPTTFKIGVKVGGASTYTKLQVATIRQPRRRVYI